MEFARCRALPHLEARRSSLENSCYRLHTHDAFSIGIIEAGASSFNSPLTGSLTLVPGDVIVIAAGQAHQCNPADGTWRYQMIHMDQDWATRLAQQDHTSQLLSGVTVLRGERVHEQAVAWSDLIFTDAPAADIESGLHQLMGAFAHAVPAHAVGGHTDAALAAQLRPVFVRLRDDGANPSIDELAEIAGLTRFELIRAVKRATGLAPLAWRQNARVQVARQMLREGAPIADTAQYLGFTDQSHFHRVFRAHVATSPGAYRV